MKMVKAWLVAEVTDWTDVFVTRPIIAFQDPDAAKRCASIRDRRAEGAEDPTWHEIDEIEVVMDD